jgi:predicted Fe-Mo cluster-binding NifX family protein
MKVAITTNGTSLDGAIDARFGRAPRFIIYDTDAGTFTVIENGQAMDAAQGAGVQAAQTVVDAGAQAVVTGHCGPKAFRALSSAGISVYTTDAATVAEAIDRFRSGALTAASSADVNGHWT